MGVRNTSSNGLNPTWDGEIVEKGDLISVFTEEGGKRKKRLFLAFIVCPSLIRQVLGCLRNYFLIPRPTVVETSRVCYLIWKLKNVYKGYVTNGFLCERKDGGPTRAIVELGRFERLLGWLFLHHFPTAVRKGEITPVHFVPPVSWENIDAVLTNDDVHRLIRLYKRHIGYGNRMDGLLRAFLTFLDEKMPLADLDSLTLDFNKFLALELIPLAGEKNFTFAVNQDVVKKMLKFLLSVGRVSWVDDKEGDFYLISPECPYLPHVHGEIKSSVEDESYKIYEKFVFDPANPWERSPSGVSYVELFTKWFRAKPSIETVKEGLPANSLLLESLFHNRLENDLPSGWRIVKPFVEGILSLQVIGSLCLLGQRTVPLKRLLQRVTGRLILFMSVGTAKANVGEDGKILIDLLGKWVDKPHAVIPALKAIKYFVFRLSKKADLMRSEVTLEKIPLPFCPVIEREELFDELCKIAVNVGLPDLLVDPTDGEVKKFEGKMNTFVEKVKEIHPNVGRYYGWWSSHLVGRLVKLFKTLGSLKGFVRLDES